MIAQLSWFWATLRAVKIFFLGGKQAAAAGSNQPMLRKMIRDEWSYHRAPLLWSISVSLIIGSCYFLMQPIAYTNDTVGYLEGARWVARYHDGRYAYLRTPLYLILMAVSGVAQGWSLLPLICIQRLMGFAIPVLVYFSFTGLDRRIGCAISIAASLSLIPFVNAGSIMPHQMYVFLVFAGITAASYYLRTGNPRVIHVMALLCFAAVMTRPQGSYLYLVFFVAIVGYHREHFRPWLGALAMLIVMLTGYMALRPFFVSKISMQASVLIPKSDGAGPIPDDDKLLDRARVFIKHNLYSDARFFRYLITSQDDKNLLDLGVVNQNLLNNVLDQALKEALAIQDAATRDKALFAIYSYSKTLGESARSSGDTALKYISHDFIASGEPATTRQTLMASNASLNQREHPVPKKYIHGLDLTNTAGRLLLYPVMALRSDFPDAVLRPEDGPATATLYRLIEAYWASHPEIMERYPDFHAVVNDPRGGTEFLLTRYTPFFAHWTVFVMLDDILGPERGDELCKRVYLEFLERHPSELASYYRKGVEANFWQKNTAVFLVHENIAPKPVFYREVDASYLRMQGGTGSILAAALESMAHLAAIPLTALAAIAGILTFTHGAAFRLWLLLWGISLHQIVMCALTVGGNFAYLGFVNVLMTMAAGVGFCGLVCALHARRKHKINV